MKTEEIKELFAKFESIVCDYNGVECWSARELQHLLGYAKWDKFLNVVEKAKLACTNAGEISANHFLHLGKMINMGQGTVLPHTLPHKTIPANLTLRTEDSGITDAKLGNNSI